MKEINLNSTLKDVEVEMLPLFRQVKDILKTIETPDDSNLCACIRPDGYVSFFMLDPETDDYMINYTEFDEKEGNIYGKESGNKVSSKDVG